VNTKLRLGPLPSTDTVKLAVTLSVGLKTQLDRYAALHSDTWGETVQATDLIPHMLTQFILRDKAFKALMRRERPNGARPQAPGQP
jgi:hypothetical protein